MGFLTLQFVLVIVCLGTAVSGHQCRVSNGNGDGETIEDDSGVTREGSLCCFTKHNGQIVPSGPCTRPYPVQPDICLLESCKPSDSNPDNLKFVRPEDSVFVCNGADTPNDDTPTFVVKPAQQCLAGEYNVGGSNNSRLTMTDEKFLVCAQLKSIINSGIIYSWGGANCIPESYGVVVNRTDNEIFFTDLQTMVLSADKIRNPPVTETVTKPDWKTIYYVGVGILAVGSSIYFLWTCCWDCNKRLADLYKCSEEQRRDCCWSVIRFEWLFFCVKGCFWRFPRFVFSHTMKAFLNGIDKIRNLNCQRFSDYFSSIYSHPQKEKLIAQQTTAIPVPIPTDTVVNIEGTVSTAGVNENDFGDEEML